MKCEQTSVPNTQRHRHTDTDWGTFPVELQGAQQTDRLEHLCMYISKQHCSWMKSLQISGWISPSSGLHGFIHTGTWSVGPHGFICTGTGSLSTSWVHTHKERVTRTSWVHRERVTGPSWVDTNREKVTEPSRVHTNRERVTELSHGKRYKLNNRLHGPDNKHSLHCV